MKKIILLSGYLCCMGLAFSQQVIQLDNKGSENWNWNEKEYFNSMIQRKLVYNVSHPTLTVFLADSATANGAAVVICPGGGFQFLSIESEGFEVARALNKKGITAFVLKYRLMQSHTDNPFQEFMSKNAGSDSFNRMITPVVAMAITDGANAMAYVRSHASAYKIDPHRIGLMGFSAGGTVTTGVAYHYTAAARPDFLAPIYPYVGSFSKGEVPPDAPPLFAVVASDDQLGLGKDCIALYQDWTHSKHVAELHIYAKGGHGFGMSTQHLPVDTWLDRFTDWLGQQGFLKVK